MAEKILKDYELMVALKPLLPDDVRKAIHKNIVKTAQDFGGSVEDVDVWGKRYLAYKIKGHNEGYYIVYNMKLSSDKIAEFKRQLELKQEILRFMFVKIENPAEVGKALKKKEIDLEIE